MVFGRKNQNENMMHFGFDDLKLFNFKETPNEVTKIDKNSIDFLVIISIIFASEIILIVIFSLALFFYIRFKNSNKIDSPKKNEVYLEMENIENKTKT